MNYEQTAEKLVARIVALGPTILELDDPWQLFKVPGFECQDIEPTLGQASAALAQAKYILRNRVARG